LPCALLVPAKATTNHIAKPRLQRFISLAPTVTAECYEKNSTS
jgi:hypothetical protein